MTKRTISSLWDEVVNVCNIPIFTTPTSHGLIKGTHLLSIEYLEMKLEGMNKSIQHLMNSGREQSLEKAKSTRNEIISKISKHYSKIK